MITRRNLVKQKSRPAKPKTSQPPPLLIGPDGLPIKRKRGRPRKYPRPNDPLPLPVLVAVGPPQPSEPLVPPPPPEGFTMDWPATFNVPYPPSTALPEITEFPVVEGGHILFEFEKELIAAMIARWWSGVPTVLSDETDFCKYAVICPVLHLLKEFCGGSFPVLMIAVTPVLARWINELGDFLENVCIFAPNRAERKIIDNTDLYFYADRPRDFDILLVSRDQFVRDYASLPPVKWSAVIVDDLTPSKASYHQSLVGLSEIKSNYFLFISSDFEHMSQPDLSTISEFVKVADLSTILVSITAKMAIDAEYIEERVIFCPMSGPQAKLCQQLFGANREQLSRVTAERRYSQYLCQFMKQLRVASTHPSLIDGSRQTSSENPEPQSGKFKELVKFLSSERPEGRKVAVICGDVKTVQLVHTCLVLRGISHTKLDGQTRVKQQEKFARHFNLNEGFCVFVLPAASVETMLPLLNADSLVALDMDWTPLAHVEEIVKWYRRPVEHRPELLRMITHNSMELIMFEQWWADRTLTVGRLESGEEDLDLQIVIDLLMKCASVLFNDSAVGDKSIILNYANRAPLFTRTFEFGESFWETIMPRVTKRTKGRTPPHKFWNEDRIDQLVDLLLDFGWNRWDRFESLGRPAAEITKVASAIVAHFHPDFKQYRGLRESLGPEYSPGELKKFASAIALGSPRMDDLSGPTFLRTLENLNAFSHIQPQSPDDFSLEGIDLPLPTEDWTLADDRLLLFLVYEHGLSDIPLAFRSEIAREELQDRALTILGRLQTSRPTTITLRTPKKLSVIEHQKILNAIMSYGYPSPEEFHEHVDVTMSLDAMARYVEAVFQYCDAQPDDRKKLLATLADKIPKYTVQKIPQRIALFKQIRAAALNLSEYPAEDIEFLTAVSSHGMASTSMSPTLTVACLGACTETKLYMRIKALFAERHHPRLIQRLPENISERMPLRINDMLMLGSIGEIDGRDGFHNELYIYPLGYRCFCVCPSPKNRDSLVWMEASVEEKNDRPLFVVKPIKGDGVRYAGATPSEPFDEIRAKIIKKTRKWMPPIDGHEMFGFTSAFVHRLLMDMRGFERCLLYGRRFFRSHFTFINEWPTIGQFEANPEKLAQAVPPPSGNPRFRFRKRAFGDSLPPLVLNFSPLFTGDESDLVVSVRSEPGHLNQLLERYQRWDEEDIKDFIPSTDPV